MSEPGQSFDDASFVAGFPRKPEPVGDYEHML